MKPTILSAALMRSIVSLTALSPSLALVAPLAACSPPQRLGPDDVLAKLTAAGFTVEKQTGGYTSKFADEDLLLFFALDGVQLLGLRFPTATKATEWCQTRKRCVAADAWAIDADDRTLPDQPFPGKRISGALSAK
jgi:hypothetical protein